MKDDFLIPVELEIDKFHNKGIDYLESKEYEKAIEMFKKEMACDPDGFCCYRDLGNTYKEIGNLQQAIENYKKALSNAERMYKESPSDMDKSIIEDIKKDLKSIEGI